MLGVNKKSCRGKLRFHKFVFVSISLFIYSTISLGTIAKANEPEKNSLPNWEESFSKTFGIGNYFDSNSSESLDDIIIIIENDTNISFPYAKQFFGSEYMNTIKTLIIVGGHLAEAFDKKHNTTQEKILFLTPLYDEKFNMDTFLNSLKSFTNSSKPGCSDKTYLRILSAPQEKRDTALNEIQRELFDEQNNSRFVKINRNDVLDKMFYSIQQECNIKSQGSMFVLSNPLQYKIIKELIVGSDVSEKAAEEYKDSYEKTVVFRGNTAYELLKSLDKYFLNIDYVLVGGLAANSIYNTSCKKRNIRTQECIYFDEDARKELTLLLQNIVIKEQINRNIYVKPRKQDFAALYTR